MEKPCQFFIENTQLGFRHYRKDDAGELSAWLNDPRINKHFTHHIPQTSEMMEEAIGRLSRSETDMGFMVIDKSDDRAFAILEIRAIDHVASKCLLEIAVCLPERQAKGLGAQIMLLAEKYIFDDLKLNKCRLHTSIANEPMNKLARKMGYLVEGILKNELFIDGRYYDEVIYSKIIGGHEGALRHIPGSVLELVGNTPVVELKRINPCTNVRLFGKLEYYNPSGSVKDRAGLEMIKAARDQGLIGKGSTIVECTSGNTGISLAMACAVMDMKCILVAPEKVIPLGKRSIMEALGAKLIETPLEGDYELSIEKAKEIAKETPGAFMPHQFENEANPRAHEKSTALEIISQFGSDIDAVVSAVGSGGTITGVGRVLKKFNPEIKIIAVEPENCAALSGGKIDVHYILGIGAGFIPKIIDRKVIDQVETVSDEEAAECCMELARKEGIFCGISTGAAVCGAIKFAKKQDKPLNVLVFAPDGGVRYVGKKGFFMDYFDKYVRENS